jgi:hypothetical protein
LEKRPITQHFTALEVQLLLLVQPRDGKERRENDETLQVSEYV